MTPPDVSINHRICVCGCGKPLTRWATRFVQGHAHGFLSKLPPTPISLTQYEGGECAVMLFEGGKSSLIDVDSIPTVAPYRWHVSAQGYVVRFEHRKAIRLHRLLRDISSPLECDHINGDRLDNRISNLRLCAHTDNSRNRVKSRRNTSGYKGVTWDKQRLKWRASIKVNRRVLHLGCFTDRFDAAQAYDAAAKEHYGEFARFNCSRYPQGAPQLPGKLARLIEEQQ